MAKPTSRVNKLKQDNKSNATRIKVANKSANKLAIKKFKKKNKRVSKKRPIDKDESVQSTETTFDEDSIKNRITDMLEQYKEQGGVLELGEENEDDGCVDQTDDSDAVEDEPIRKPIIKKPTNKLPKDDEKPGDPSNTQVDKEKREKREKRKFDFERNSRTIFVGNLPNTITDHKKVAKLFKICGPVEAARIRSVVPEKEKLAPKVALIAKRTHPKVDSFNAYVVFTSNENDECVKKALEMNGKVIDGHHIRVDRAQRPKAKKETLTSRKKSVFVGNLRFDLRDDELINHFKKIGSVNYVRIVRDRSSGLGKGFGFVAFDERASATKAIELNDTQFKGRAIRVKKIQ